MIYAPSIQQRTSAGALFIRGSINRECTHPGTLALIVVVFVSFRIVSPFSFCWPCLMGNLWTRFKILHHKPLTAGMNNISPKTTRTHDVCVFGNRVQWKLSIFLIRFLAKSIRSVLQCTYINSMGVCKFLSLQQIAYSGFRCTLGFRVVQEKREG